MGNVLIVAYGNPLRSDDALAWHAAEIMKRMSCVQRPVIHTCFQLTPELASLVSDATAVVFVDAARDGEPGKVVTTEIHPKRQSSAFTHEFSPESILELSENLYSRLPCRAWSVSMAGECFDHGERLSPIVNENLPNLVSAIRNIVDEQRRHRVRERIE